VRTTEEDWMNLTLPFKIEHQGKYDILIEKREKGGRRSATHEEVLLWEERTRTIILLRAIRDYSTCGPHHPIMAAICPHCIAVAHLAELESED
jgi:hypothetical protein